MQTLLMMALLLVSVFLILLILVQRGRGGGLAGALGGAGGSSAFGAKAGDNFTWFTIYTASTWIVLCVVAVIWSNNFGQTDALSGAGPVSETADVETGAGAGATDEPPAGESATPESPAESPGE
ncbi:MAG: preprotein translocase subunit SecG [Planctomycetota bacterium]